MSTSPLNETPLGVAVWIERGKLFVSLSDGREIGTPLSHFPRLAAALPEDLADWKWIGSGQGIHWPRLDEDISLEGLLRGDRPPTPSKKVVEEYSPLVLAARKCTGLTQAELAERMGYSQTYVSLAERGKTPFARFYVEEVLKACELPMEWKP
jgi:DNA-binding XRE family transcriptional regulator